MTSPDDHAHVIGGMFAAIECARLMDHARTGQIDPAAAQAGLELVRADCIRGGLDIMGSLATIGVRAGVLACQASEAAGHPLTVQQFLDELQAELTLPDDPGAIL